MKHIILNPHNGSEVDYAGIVLQPGYGIAVSPLMAHDLSERFAFLLVREVAGEFNPKKVQKATKIKDNLQWETMVEEDPDLPDHATHVVA